MKFGGWSYNGFLMDITQLPNKPNDVIETRYDNEGRDYQFLNPGMDLSAYYPSLEWDVIELTSKRHEQLYPGCCGQDMYIDITFEMILRRKALFYTVNLVIPCVLFGKYHLVFVHNSCFSHADNIRLLHSIEGT